MSRHWRPHLWLAACALTVSAAMMPWLPAFAGDKTPWKADVTYGAHPLDTLDIYRPPGEAPAPAILFIHGGGWWNGDKKFVPGADVAYFSSRGIAFVAINYRNLPSAHDDGLYPPLLGPLRDAQRALQYVRYHAAELRIDPKRIALMGESAGAYDALWLGLAKDRADPRSPDPVARMSTRVRAIGAADAQTSIDPAQMREWVGPSLRYGGHAFGLPEADFPQFLAMRDEFTQYFPALSPASLVERRSPPVFLIYKAARNDSSTDPMYYVHSPGFGTGFAALARQHHANVTLRIGTGTRPEDRLVYLQFLADSVTR